MVSERVHRINVSPTMNVAAKAIAMKREGIPVIDLSVGEPDFPTPSNIREAAKRAIDGGQTRYTQNMGTVELRTAIQAKLKEDNGLEYGLQEIIVSCGAKQSIFNAIHSTVYTGDEVIIPAPYWVSYPEMVTLAHGTPVIVPTVEANGFKLTPEVLTAAITVNTKLLILCNPSNPTGTVYTREELMALASVCLKHNFYILSDEIYEKLLYEDFPFCSFAALDTRLKERTIVINGVSKTYAMTGWRIGYAAGPEAVIRGIDKIQSHSTSNASSISQAATIEALTGPQDDIAAMRAEYSRRRDYLHDALSAMPGIRCYKSGGAFYLFPNITAYFGKGTPTLRITNSFDFSMYLLHQAHVATVAGSAFGSEGYLRLSYATSMENLKAAVTRIQEALLLLE